MEYSELLKHFKASNGVSTDTRADLNNKIFVALKGPNFNGNDYIDQAFAKGACYVIGDEPKSQDPRFILVDDSLRYLQSFATHYRRQHPAQFIGITGSNGKTTTKELLHSVLSQKFSCQATIGNLNNHIGVPLTLLNIKPDCEVAIIEMGANHPKEIALLSSIAEPDYGLITNIGKAHLEGFGSLEGVDTSKRELFDFIEEKGKKQFINYSDPFLKKAAAKYSKSVLYGNGASNYIKNIQEDQEAGIMHIDLVLDNESTTCQSHLFGRFNAENVLAAASVGSFLGLSLEQISAGISAYQPNNNRSQVKKTERNVLIIDAYNSNPSSAEKAILAFAESTTSGKLAIIGAMKEGGDNSPQAHREISLLLEEKGIDNWLVGEEFEGMLNKHTLSYFKSSTEILENVGKLEAITGKAVLLKGSRSVALEKLIPHL